MLNEKRINESFQKTIKGIRNGDKWKHDLWTLWATDNELHIGSFHRDQSSSLINCPSSSEKNMKLFMSTTKKVWKFTAWVASMNGVDDKWHSF